VNAALAQVRKRRHLEVAWPQGDSDAAPFDAADESPTPDREAMSAELRGQLDDELARMSPLERAAFVLRHQEGRSIEEICAVLSVNVSAAKQAIFRAVRKLRAALEAPGEPA
jgi:RNA polymerase sigma-70 factor (ECF subfamily)